jgi:hypothetical protein
MSAPLISDPVVPDGYQPSFLRITSVLDQVNPTLDPWHYVGFGTQKNLTQDQTYEHLIKSLPLREFDTIPFQVGWTGYVEQTDDMELPIVDFRSVDPIGRQIFVVNSILYFQRYLSGKAPLMKGIVNNKSGCFNDCAEQSDWDNLGNYPGDLNKN